ncbi:hypothetical protein PLICRDRAFT_173496 [Plicaturopsis crispa FD-325 SS-3]|nr:hypothetical protein PLICRDRAFT_173496 [Plicaturopsis crispa FD-325 SS-3]
MKLTLSIAFAALAALVQADRTITVYNGCPFTIWPALFTDPKSPSFPSQATGWEAAAYTSVSFLVPDDWKSGRIWGRRDCDFSTNPGPNSCVDGGCNGGLECDPQTGTGVPPATVVEFTLSGGGTTDNYDGESFSSVSLVDGYNLPVSLTNNVGCPVGDCPVDLGPDCPAALQGPFDSSGFPVGCRSACQAGLSPDPANSPDCCTGSHGTAATCPPSGVDYYSYFKDRCPNSYVYAYDESSGTALLTCDASKGADYTITFCP